MKQPNEIPGLIKTYEDACNAISQAFVRKYYGENATEVYWVGDKIAGVLFVNNESWDMRDMITAIRLDYPKDKLFSWYSEMNDHYLILGVRDGFPNLESYLTLNNHP